MEKSDLPKPESGAADLPRQPAPGKKPGVAQEDLSYADDMSAALLLRTPRRSQWLLYSIVLFVVSALVWAHFAQVDEVTVGHGKVIPSQQIQVVQNLEGGILKEIFVDEGDVVAAGERLLTIDETRFRADFREREQERLSLLSEATRLEAEIDSVQINDRDASEPVKIEPQTLSFADVIRQGHAELITRQQSLYNERLRKLKNQLQIFHQQEEQKRQELIEIDTRIGFLKESYQLVNKELKLTRPLAQRGVVSDVELLQLKRQANDLKGELQAAKQLKPKVRAALSETVHKRIEAALKFRNEAQQQLAETEAELGSLNEALISLKDRLKRTQVVSPVKGKIKTIKINTVGGVIQPGMDLIEIVPLEDSLLVEAKVSPRDIAFIRPGLDAVIKLSAYDFTVYGGLHGKLEHISADTIQDEEDNSFYLIRVRTDDSYVDANNESLPIIPGMLASVDVITGKKSILDYLLKPIIRAKQNALRER